MTHPFAISKILAPTDLTPSTQPALMYARFFAQKFKAKLTILYSDPISYPVDLAVAPVRRHDSDLRSEVIQSVTPLLPNQPYDVVITTGYPVPAILQSAKEHDIDLIVVGTHRTRGFARIMLGSVSDGVLYGSECPVLTVPADEERPMRHARDIKTILCPVNFSEVARESLRAAAALARSLHAELIVVHVIDPGDTTSAYDGERHLDRWIRPIFDETKWTYRSVVLRGNASERVIDAAEGVDADLIVVGAQHKFFRNATVIGGTAERLIRFAPCPVFVVPRAALFAKKQVAEGNLVAVEGW